VKYVSDNDKPIDFNVYYLAAKAFINGQNPYDIRNSEWAQLAKHMGIVNYTAPYRYPPLTAELTAPLTRLSPRNAAVVWLSISAAAFISSAWLLGRLSPASWGISLALLLLSGFVPALTTLYAGQVNALVLLFLTITLWGLVRKQPLLAGTSAAVGILLKVVPVAQLCYLGWRRRWSTLIWGMPTILLLSGVSLAFTGFDGWGAYIRHFVELSETGSLVPSGANQTINGFLSRLLVGHIVPAAIHSFVFWLSLFMVLATMALCWPIGDSALFVPLEFGLITVAINIITPYAWYHQYALLLIPFFILAEHALRIPSHRWWLFPLGAGYFFIDLHGLLWHRLERFPLLASMPFFTSLLLWGCLAWLLWVGKRGVTSR